MATPEKPPSRLPGGKINPAWTAWRKEVKRQAETPKPEVLTLRVISKARNATFVYCDHDGNKVAVRLKNRRDADKLMGKVIPVTQDEGGIYHHSP